MPNYDDANLSKKDSASKAGIVRLNFENPFFCEPNNSDAVIAMFVGQFAAFFCTNDLLRRFENMQSEIFAKCLEMSQSRKQLGKASGWRMVAHI